MSGVILRGKQILVTGASAGLGVETARSLAAHGARGTGLKNAEAATAQVLLLCGFVEAHLVTKPFKDEGEKLQWRS